MRCRRSRWPTPYCAIAPFHLIDAREERLGSEVKDLSQFLASDAEDFVFGEGKNLFVARAAKEAADEGRGPPARGAETCCGQRWRPACVCLRCAGTRKPKPGGRDWRTFSS